MNLTGIIMDTVLIGLLLLALWFGVRLNNRLKVLRAGQEEFARAVSELDQAAIRAHHSLKELRADADDSQELLHGRILAAREVLQKLETQVTRAERTARDLEGNVASVSALQSRAEEAARQIALASRPEPRPETRMETRSSAPVREVRTQPKLEQDTDYNPAWSAPPKTPTVARGAEVKRDPFERDIIRFKAPVATEARRSILPDEPEEDESEILDKVQMSELVVANLNDMIRSLTLPDRQVLSVEDDLFGGDEPPAKKR